MCTFAGTLHLYRVMLHPAEALQRPTRVSLHIQVKRPAPPRNRQVPAVPPGGARPFRGGALAMRPRTTPSAYPRQQPPTSPEPHSRPQGSAETLAQRSVLAHEAAEVSRLPKCGRAFHWRNGVQQPRPPLAWRERNLAACASDTRCRRPHDLPSWVGCPPVLVAGLRCIACPNPIRRDRARRAATASTRPTVLHADESRARTPLGPAERHDLLLRSRPTPPTGGSAPRTRGRDSVVV
jgi:hypothetical protein